MSIFGWDVHCLGGISIVRRGMILFRGGMPIVLGDVHCPGQRSNKVRRLNDCESHAEALSDVSHLESDEV